MASRATKALATGVRVLGGANVKAYTLEFLTADPKHEKGTFTTIVVPYAELGRDKNCQVQFLDEASTISRRHAAIERKDQDVILKNLSKTNPTLVNGKPITEQYYLTSGDEIQLSVEGPKLRYNEASNATQKMGFTQRMNLVVQQAVKPYRKVVITMAVALLVISVAAAYFIISLRAQNKELLVRVELTDKVAADSMAALNTQNAELSSKLLENKNELKRTIDELENAQKQKMELEKQQKEATAKASSTTQTSKVSPPPVTAVPVSETSAKTTAVRYEDLVAMLKNRVLAIYLTKISVQWNGNTILEEEPDKCMCTGFLLDDGKLVTARHCVDLHSTEASELNFVANSGGVVTYHFKAISPDGKITYKFTNHDMAIDTRHDVYEKYTYAGVNGSIKLFDPFTGVDWAYINTQKTGGLEFNQTLSSGLKSGAELFCLGYSYGEQYRDRKVGFDPYFTTAKVSTTGLQNNCIIVSDFGFDSGSSGAPLFYISNNTAIAVGIVSGTYMKGQEKNANVGIVTPLVNLR